jgi:hypothetical protein
MILQNGIAIMSRDKGFAGCPRGPLIAPFGPDYSFDSPSQAGFGNTTGEVGNGLQRDFLDGLRLH